MILDAATHEQVAAVDRILRGVEGVDLPGRAEDGALRVRVRDQHRCLRRRRRGRRGAARPAACRGRGGRARGARDRRRRHASVRAPRGAADREGGALRDVRRLRRDLRSAPGRPGAARPRRHAVRPRSAGAASMRSLPWLPVVLALSANSPWFAGELTGMASNRAPILAELPRGGAPPAFGSYARVGGVGRAARRDRRDGGLHAHLVGRAPASRSSGRSRCACPTSRPTSGCRPRSLRSSRRCARRRSRAAARRLAARRLHPEPVGGGALRAAREPDPSRRHCRSRPRPSSRVELLERVRPAAERLGGAEVAGASRSRRAARRSGSSAGAHAREAAAELVRRSLA